MKTFRIVATSLSIMALFSMSACLQAASTPSKTKPQSAGPLALKGEDAKPSELACQTPEGRDLLAQIGEGADALFQILQTDVGDLTTIHDRAERLASLENDYSEKFVGDCSNTGLTVENTSARIEKLNTLEKETDQAVIGALAHEIWDLFNPNITTSNDGGTTSANPFPKPAKG